jgi:hypothetical protein
MTKLEFMVRAFTLQNEQIKIMAEEQRTLLASIIKERKNSDNTYSDIVSDGGLDPRTKYEAEKFKRQWVGLTDEEIKDIVGRNDPDGVGRYTRELFRKIEAKLKEKNG